MGEPRDGEVAFGVSAGQTYRRVCDKHGDPRPLVVLVEHGPRSSLGLVHCSNQMTGETRARWALPVDSFGPGREYELEVRPAVVGTPLVVVPAMADLVRDAVHAARAALSRSERTNGVASKGLKTALDALTGALADVETAERPGSAVASR